MSQDWITASTYYRIVNTYNPNRTLATSHLQTGGVIAPDTQYTYGDCNGLKPTTITAGGLTTNEDWNCSGGVLNSVSDANGSNSFVYDDPLWRLRSSTDKNGVTTNYSYTSNTMESSLLFNSGNSIIDTVTTLDSLGRTKLAQKRLGPSATNYRTVQYVYNPNGQLYSVSRPCSVALGAACTAFPSTFQYNAIGRTIVSDNGSGGYVTNTYNGRDVLLTLGPAPTGENTKRKRMEYDASGRLTSVCEITTGAGSGTCGQYISDTGYWTKYSWVAAATDNVLTITQGAEGGTAQTRTLHYGAPG
jgi:hypothetical protein